MDKHNQNKTAQEVSVQEQYIQEIVHLQLNKFKRVQSVLFVIQVLIILMFMLMLIKEKKYVNELIYQLNKLKDLLSNF